MTVLVLEALRTIDEQTFNATAAAQWGARAADKKKGTGALTTAQGASSSSSSSSVKSHVFAKPAPPPAVRAKVGAQAAPKISSLPQVKGAKSGRFALTTAPWANKPGAAGGGAMAGRPGAMGGAMAGRPGAVGGGMGGGMGGGDPSQWEASDGGTSTGGSGGGSGRASGGTKPTGVFDCTPGAGK